MLFKSNSRLGDICSLSSHHVHRPRSRVINCDIKIRKNKYSSGNAVYLAPVGQWHALQTVQLWLRGELREDDIDGPCVSSLKVFFINCNITLHTLLHWSSQDKLLHNACLSILESSPGLHHAGCLDYFSSKCTGFPPFVLVFPPQVFLFSMMLSIVTTHSFPTWPKKCPYKTLDPN